MYNCLYSIPTLTGEHLHLRITQTTCLRVHVPSQKMILSAWPIIPIILSVRSCYTLYIQALEILIYISTINVLKLQLNNWLSRNPEVHYLPYITPPLIPIFSKSYPILGLPKGLLLSGFPTKTLHAFTNCSMSCPSQSSRFKIPNNVKRRRCV